MARGLPPPGGGGAVNLRFSSVGFAKGEASSCCFYDAEFDVRRVVRGGDFACAGRDADLDVVEKCAKGKFTRE
eukprot:1249828-Alexandrium_andersonii.AAC.1